MGISVKNLGMSSKISYKELGTGWLHEFPDFRDYTKRTKEIVNTLEPLKLSKVAPSTLPDSTNLTEWCTPIEDQAEIGSCTANAGVALIEYFEKKAFGNHIDGSRLFLYKVTRNLMALTGDTGAYLRTTMAAMRMFGVPMEMYWPYEISKFDEEPTAFLYSFAENFKSIKYYRLDPPGTQPDSLLHSIKTNIAAGLPCMFGFTVYNSIKQAADTGKIPFPCPNESVMGGHAIAAVGYDDKMKIKNSDCDQETTGAFLIRNSWSEKWGDGGYGWLPYEYVKQGLADDWWTMMKMDWVETEMFGLGKD